MPCHPRSPARPIACLSPTTIASPPRLIWKGHDFGHPLRAGISDSCYAMRLA
ncbi:hypothetical protein [Lysobacter gummosus]|uniref:hypothetical protein n=1 Tax=Lysobacter gummosus TaxID=262324 RepID=UPI003645DD56